MGDFCTTSRFTIPDATHLWFICIDAVCVDGLMNNAILTVDATIYRIPIHTVHYILLILPYYCSVLNPSWYE